MEPPSIPTLYITAKLHVPASGWPRYTGNLTLCNYQLPPPCPVLRPRNADDWY